MTKTGMMTTEEARKKAAKYQVPGAGQFVRMPVQVALAFMKMHNLKKLRWDGDYLVVVPDVAVVNAEQKSEGSE